MTLIGGTVTDTSLQWLEALDFEPGCAHSQHETLKQSHDDGPAKYIAESHFPCGHRVPPIPVCAKFAEQVVPSVLSIWRCTTCDELVSAEDVTWNVRPLNEST